MCAEAIDCVQLYMPVQGIHISACDDVFKTSVGESAR
jgi:hypothetical protein